MYVLYKSYVTLFPGVPEDGVLTESQAKDVLTKQYRKTGKPHPLGLKLFREHPDLLVKSGKVVHDFTKLEVKKEEPKKESKKSKVKDDGIQHETSMGEL